MMGLYPDTSVPSTVTNTLMADLPQAIGSNGAKNMPTRPNTRDVIFDSEENYFYMRVTDVHGKIMEFKRFKYDECPEPKPEDIFVTRDDFNALKQELMGGMEDVKQFIQNFTVAAADNAGAKSNDGQYKGNKSNSGNSKNFGGKQPGSNQ